MFVLSQVGQLGDRVDERGSNTLAVVCNEGDDVATFWIVKKESNMRRTFSFWWVFYLS